MRYPVLVPNVRGMERALAAGVREVAVFTAASESFTRHNINATIAESLANFARGGGAGPAGGRAPARLRLDRVRLPLRGRTCRRRRCAR